MGDTTVGRWTSSGSAGRAASFTQAPFAGIALKDASTWTYAETSTGSTDSGSDVFSVTHGAQTARIEAQYTTTYDGNGFELSHSATANIYVNEQLAGKYVATGSTESYQSPSGGQPSDAFVGYMGAIDELVTLTPTAWEVLAGAQALVFGAAY